MKIVLIHGLYLTSDSWSGWLERFREQGVDVIAPPWPGLDRSVEALRDDPAPLKRLNIETVVGHYDRIVRELDEPPIIVGHSFGGLFAQILAYRGLGAAVVSLHGVAPAGVLDLPFSTLKASAPVLANPFNIGGATMLTPEQFHYAFTTPLTAEEARPLYERYAIPACNRILFEGAFENFTPHSPARVDVRTQRPPVLLVTGTEDRLVTAGYTRSNYKLIAQSPSLTAFREFPGRPHFTGAVPGWEEVADFVLDWALHPRPGEPDGALHAR
ncbi:MAG: alpha/beta fold hydrolase [Candidatus Eremiobacteraeota bacterium]|nr:alpha/beta fold hydrolase [Candidatus Eremiobacteraeota bacterium]